ncbi:hypothetical protein SUGI_0246370 [Cryptomeria japonica]|nr:hypothetical protein SUGI_0246370 [Cryptomeria japonica]
MIVYQKSAKLIFLRFIHGAIVVGGFSRLNPDILGLRHSSLITKVTSSYVLYQPSGTLRGARQWMLRGGHR